MPLINWKILSIPKSSVIQILRGLIQNVDIYEIGTRYSRTTLYFSYFAVLSSCMILEAFVTSSSNASSNDHRNKTRCEIWNEENLYLIM